MSVGLDNLVQLYLIGLAIIIVAVSASSITVMRLKPREILSKIEQKLIGILGVSAT